MSTNYNDSKDNNKDYDNHNKAEIWSDNRLQNTIFNQLIDTEKNYINQATTKFEDLIANSASTFFDIDIRDLDTAVIRNLEYRVKNYKNPEEKYRRLNSIFANSIYFLYKRRIQSQIISIIDKDPVIVKGDIDKIYFIISFKWRLTDADNKLQSCNLLNDLIGYAHPSSLSITKEDKVENFEKYSSADEIDTESEKGEDDDDHIDESEGEIESSKNYGDKENTL